MVCFVCLEDSCTHPPSSHLIKEHGWPSILNATPEIEVAAYFWKTQFIVDSLAILLGTTLKQQYLSEVASLAVLKKSRYLLPPDYSRESASRLILHWRGEYERLSRKLIAALLRNPFHGKLLLSNTLRRQHVETISSSSTPTSASSYTISSQTTHSSTQTTPREAPTSTPKRAEA
jgi:hypothetical protein